MNKMLFLFLLFPFTAMAAPDLSDRIQISEIVGSPEVRVVRSQTKKEELVKLGEMVFVGDEIISAKGQIVALTAYDGAKWKVAQDTRLKLESRKPEKKGLFYWTFNIVKGGMWGEVPKGDKDAFKLKVKTKNSAMGIRGTEYLVEGDETRSGLDVLEGVILWGKDINFAPGTFREVHAGEHAEMDTKGVISVRASQGDKTALATHYGLVPTAPGGEPGKK